MEFTFKEKYGISDLLDIMRILRSENGCPWDREQDHKSIRRDFLEEVYEAVEAIDLDDKALLREELGDVLLQVVFHARIEEECGNFDFGDVVNEVCQKLVTRHPHVFGDVTAETSEEVLKNWNNIKQQTKGQETYAETLESVCTALPALMRAQKIGQRAKRAGMDFADVGGVLDSLESEIAELKAAIKNGNPEEIKDELGDVLFSCTNLARHLDCDAEEVLTMSAVKFTKRFKAAEELIRCDGLDMRALNIDELDAYWRKAKTK
ncbi:MAG: nucleoside triphosphate pyrophosphohydrolase [Ruminococcus sp.]|nr:nucleoside triphosphate pyrophosphohydrolase [Ruminococcus sp.]MCM1382652.1 nucleoside triphosphate pyrophosphohydrolase [Muribaculaceae bacterium]MCM1479083.1 nucleoside triphosphate pyrophosphohydrolase [Muribaculaceae bacterium]